MTKRSTLAVLLSGPTALTLSVAAQTTSPQAPVAPSYTLGKTVLTAARFHQAGSSLFLSQGVTVTAPDYDMNANQVHAFSIFDKGGPKRIVADGEFIHGTFVQVIGHFTSVTQGQKYTVFADRAVYVPDDSRPGGGTIDLTGHPKVITLAPGALAEPSTSTFDHAVVTLGQGPDYPQVDGTNGHTTLVPNR